MQNRELHAAAIAAANAMAAKAAAHPAFQHSQIMERWNVWTSSGGKVSAQGKERLSYCTFRLFPASIEDGPHASETQELAGKVLQVRGCKPEEALLIAYRFLRMSVFLFEANDAGLMNRVAEVYPNFEADVLAPAGKEYVRPIAPIMLFESSSERIVLANGLTIRKCEDRDFRELQDSAQFGPPGLVDRFGSMSSHVAAAEWLVDTKKAEELTQIWWPFEQLAIFAYLFRPSDFYISRLSLPSSMTRYPGGTSFRPAPYLLPDVGQIFPTGTVLKLTPDDEVSFKTKHEQFIKCFRTAPLPLYLRRFANGCYETGAEDRLLDLMIALEALVLHNDRFGTQSSRIALRIAWLLGTSVADRKAKQKQALNLYDLRSKIAHGNDLELTHAELIAKAAEAEDLGRRVIWAEIESKVSTGTGIDWGNLVFGKDLPRRFGDATCRGDA